ncbi:MAG: hypothetical protein J0H17_01420 [Rhizobiales bacterium]|nr:hypothetical protein [Hyphomicrobiales bacterium]
MSLRPIHRIQRIEPDANLLGLSDEMKSFLLVLAQRRIHGLRGRYFALDDQGRPMRPIFRRVVADALATRGLILLASSRPPTAPITHVRITGEGAWVVRTLLRRQQQRAAA